VALLAIRSLASGASAPCPPDAFLTPVARLIARADLPPKILDEAAATLQLLEVEAAPVLTSLRREIEAKLQTLGEGERAAVRVRDSTEPRHLERALAAAARGRHERLPPARGIRSLHPHARRAPGISLVALSCTKSGRPCPTSARVSCTPTPASLPANHRPSVRHGRGHAHARPRRAAGERGRRRLGLFLPRVDDLLAACSLAPEPLRLVTPVGTVTVRAPASRRRAFEPAPASRSITLVMPRLARLPRRRRGRPPPPLHPDGPRPRLLL
jgi:hypothetical protein